MSIEHLETGADSELEQRIAEAGARQSEYDNWRSALAADCLRRGIAFPSSFALQRAWNAHQKQKAELRKAEKQAQHQLEKLKAARAKQLQRMQLLQERAENAAKELAQLTGAEYVPGKISGAYQSPITKNSSNSPMAPSADAEPDDAFFAQIDAEIAAIQAGDTGGCRTPMAPNHALQEQRTLHILQEEEAALRKNNLGEL